MANIEKAGKYPFMYCMRKSDSLGGYSVNYRKRNGKRKPFTPSRKQAEWSTGPAEEFKYFREHSLPKRDCYTSEKRYQSIDLLISISS